jgi:hypothetical protein
MVNNHLVVQMFGAPLTGSFSSAGQAEEAAKNAPVLPETKSIAENKPLKILAQNCQQSMLLIHF